MNAPDAPATLTAMAGNDGDGLASPDRLVDLLAASGAGVIGLQELNVPAATVIERELGDR